VNVHIDYDSLHPLERKIIPHLRNGADVEELAAQSGMVEVEVVRALQWLAAKGALTIHEKAHHVLTTGPNWKAAVANGLPEYRFLKLLEKKHTVPEIQQYFTIDEFNAALGLLKKRDAIIFGAGKVQKTAAAARMLDEEATSMAFLRSVTSTPYDKLDKKLLAEFRARKDFISVHERMERTIKLTPGFRPEDIKHEDLLEQVTPDVIKNKSWKETRFRRYDVDAFVPQKHYGKAHFVNEAIEDVRNVWVSMGFTEMEGPIVQTAFWDLDALFVPQDHPAREMQDTLYVKGVGKLPKQLLPLVRQAHEEGIAGSTGWGGQYSEQEAKRLLLRTHCTVLTAQTLNTLKPEDLPAKRFAIGKVFRNEAIDWKHLAEFHQVEGIIVGDVTMQDLIGMQQAFYKKLGFPKVRFRPAYFPYTEPSCEVEVWHPQREEWIEIGGMGMIRPEVIAMLMGEGKVPKNVRVAAWGLGLERIITVRYGIDDLRQLYTSDSKLLKRVEVWR
jgi:phenylalanyl-tRNA synthetase alpha chain